MNFYNLILILLFMKTTSVFSSVFPQPLEFKTTEQIITFSSDIQINTSGRECEKSVRFFTNYLDKYYSHLTNTTNSQKKNPKLIFEVKSSKKKRKGAYRVKIDESEIRLTGYNEEGLFYAMQTLIQLLPADPDCTELFVPLTDISDEPQMEYRSMHLDVARHIFSVDYLKQFIDYLAMHKMNVFHWHLTDDQGWRLEIPEYPRLTETGAWRNATIIGIYPGTGIDSTRYGGFYTQKDVLEVVKYAEDRYITIVPEIDIPGHCMAVIASYPELSTDPSKSYKVAETWGIFNKQNNVLAPSADVVCFMEAVFKNVAELFPGPYIHFGGDECSLKWWKESKLVQQFMNENKMDDERQVQSWFVKQAERIISGLGKKAIAWGEALDAGASLNTIIMSWKNEKAGIVAAQKGHYVIMSPQRYAYFNHKQIKEEKSPSHPILVTVDSVYRYPLYPKILSAKEKKQIIGASGCLWTEYYPTEKRVEYAIFPRMTALSEVLWGISGRKRDAMTKDRWLIQKARYDLWQVNYCEAIWKECIDHKNSVTD